VFLAIANIMRSIPNHRYFNGVLALCGGLLVVPGAVRADEVLPRMARPTFGVTGGVNNRAQTVTIASATSGASIAYTTDGSIPTESGGIVTHGILYSDAVSITPPTTLSAIAFKSGYLDSGVRIEGYALPAAVPAVDPIASDLAMIDPLPMATVTPTLNVLFNFSATSGGGITPVGNLVQYSDGTFYGMTNLGGSGNNGSVFKMTPAGALTTLVSFTGTNGTDPDAGLVLGSDGNFYGMANGGGSSSDGTVFKMTPAGVLTTLVSFTGTNGSFPDGALVQGSDGNFYGVAGAGGSSNFGTVFKITPAGVLTTLVSFTGTIGADLGSSPAAGLVQGSDGNFYGTTEFGGTANDGTVFKMTPTGTLTTLVSFTGAANGANPRAALVQGSDGNFYGTTQLGGSSSDGIVFKITPTGTLTTLVSFTGAANGAAPYEDLVPGSDGNFYGATNLGGSANEGTVFMMTPAGVLTTLLSFTGTNGAFARTGLMQSIDGNFYGTTLDGGSASDGVAFQLIALPPVAAPAFSPVAGTHAGAQTVTITSTTSGASFYYTTDGSTPSEFNGTLYSGPVMISSTMTLNAIAHASGFSDSSVTSGTFTITAATPMASSGGGGAPSYWFYLAIAALAAARYVQIWNTAKSIK
jgi:uncharacterized repeat protein (TIGR03803 family)